MATMLEKIEQARREGYTDLEITNFLGRSDPRIQQAVSEGYSLDEIAKFMKGKQTVVQPQAPSRYEYDPMTVGQPTPEQQQRGASQQAEFRNVMGQAITNLPSSAARLVGDLATAVTSPIQTGQALVDLGAGALQAALPKAAVDAIGSDPRSQEVFNRVGQYYADRYGSVEGAKRAIAEDPAGVLADAASVLYGVSGALRGTAGLSTAATGGRVPLTPIRQAGESIRAAGTAIDPLVAGARGATAALGAAGSGAAQFLGATTGAGGESIRQAFQAGREGGERSAQFRANISGNADQLAILDAARQNLNSLRDQRASAYRSGMVDISKDKTVLDFSGIDQALKNAEGRTKFQGKIKDPEAARALDAARQIVEDWKTSDPVLYHTPEGFDALKQSIGAVLENLDPRTNSYNTVNQVYNATRKEIVKQAPVYANTMRQYTQASDQIREIEKALSLRDTASADTAMRKLQSLMRDNVNTNFGQRVRLGRELEAQGGQLMMPGLAGQALQSAVPRGIQAATMLPTGGVSYMAGGVPAALASAALSSPRLMGEAAFMTGVGGRGIDIARQAPFMLDPELYNLLLQGGQVQGLTQ